MAAPTNPSHGQSFEVYWNGDQTVTTSGGAGTQYTEGDTDATITGTAFMIEGAANAVVAAIGGAGAVSGAVQRVTLASDDPAVVALQIMDDWDEADRAKVNIIAGQVGVQGGSGVVTALTQRVVLATDVALPAGEAHIGEVGGSTSLIDLTFTLDTSAYASGDVIAEVQALTNAVRVATGTAVLQDITLVDEDDQGVAFTLHFFDGSVTLGAENSAPSISDADARKHLGYIDVATTDWKDLGGVRVCSLKNVGMTVKPASGRDIYVGIVNSTGTPTFTASGLRGRFKFLCD